MDIVKDQPNNVRRDKHDKVYFVERTNDGELFMMNEKEVQRRFYENTSIYNAKFKVLGVSDGSTMKEYMRKHGKELKEKKEKKARLEERFDRYIDKEDELLFEEFLDDDDPKLKRLRKRKEEVKAKIRDLIEEIGGKEGKIWKEAQQAELEVAKENGATLPDPPSEIIHSKRSSEEDKRKIERTLGK